MLSRPRPLFRWLGQKTRDVEGSMVTYLFCSYRCMVVADVVVVCHPQKGRAECLPVVIAMSDFSLKMSLLWHCCLVEASLTSMLCLAYIDSCFKNAWRARLLLLAVE